MNDPATLAAADALYAIVREQTDPSYKLPEPPDEQDRIDAVIAYEQARKIGRECGEGSQPVPFTLDTICRYISRESLAKAKEKFENSEDWSIYRDHEKRAMAFEAGMRFAMMNNVLTSLLRRYIRHVQHCEGVNFLTLGDTHDEWMNNFTAEEYAFLCTFAVNPLDAQPFDESPERLDSCVPKGWEIGVIDCSIPGRVRSTLRRTGKSAKLWHERDIFTERNVPLIVGGTAGSIVESIVNAARDARDADRQFMKCLSPEERMLWSGDQ